MSTSGGAQGVRIAAPTEAIDRLAVWAKARHVDTYKAHPLGVLAMSVLIEAVKIMDSSQGISALDEGQRLAMVLEIVDFYLFAIDVHVYGRIGKEGRDRIIEMLRPLVLDATIEALVAPTPDMSPGAYAEALATGKRLALAGFTTRYREFAASPSATVFLQQGEDPTKTVVCEFARNLPKRLGSPSDFGGSVVLIGILSAGFARLSPMLNDLTPVAGRGKR